VTAVDDAPTFSAPGLFTVKEDMRGNLAWPAQGMAFADIDSSQLTVTLSVQDGSISTTSTAAVAVRGTATARSFSGTTTALNAYFRKLGSIGYTPAPNSTVARILTTTVSDGNLSASKVSTIRITPVNDAPTVFAAAALTGGRPGIPYEITYESLKTAANVADVETANPGILIQAINSGRLQKWNGTAWVAVSAAANAPLSQKLLSAGQKLRWLPPAGAVGNRPAFKIKASDGALTSAMTTQLFVDLQNP
jgi:nucleoid-associated protein YgaU